MKCNHLWELIEKGVTASGEQYYEFYCKMCREILADIPKGPYKKTEARKL